MDQTTLVSIKDIALSLTLLHSYISEERTQINLEQVWHKSKLIIRLENYT